MPAFDRSPLEFAPAEVAVATRVPVAAAAPSTWSAPSDPVSHWSSDDATS